MNFCNWYIKIKTKKRNIQEVFIFLVKIRIYIISNKLQTNS